MFILISGIYLISTIRIQVKQSILSFLADIFLQQCHFLRQAGHTEKAVCLFQALLDFTFFKPDSVKDLPTRQQVYKQIQKH